MSVDVSVMPDAGPASEGGTTAWVATLASAQPSPRPIPQTAKIGVYAHSDSMLVSPAIAAALISIPIAINRSAGNRSASRPVQ